MLSHLKLHFNNAQRADETVLGAYPSTIRRRVLRYLYLDVLQAGRLAQGNLFAFLWASERTPGGWRRKSQVARPRQPALLSTRQPLVGGLLTPLLPGRPADVPAV